METVTGRYREISNRKAAEDAQSRKANKNNIIFVISAFLFLAVTTGIIIGYIYLGGIRP